MFACGGSGVDASSGTREEVEYTCVSALLVLSLFTTLLSINLFDKLDAIAVAAPPNNADLFYSSVLAYLLGTVVDGEVSTSS